MSNGASDELTDENIRPWHANPADRPRVIAASVAVATFGFALFFGAPIVAGSLIHDLGFTEEQIGYLTSGDFGGMFFSSILTAWLVIRVDRRLLAGAGLVLAIAGNLASLVYQDFNTLLALRWLSGTGAGTAYAVALAVLAGTSQVGRNVTIMIVSMVFTNAVVLEFFPNIDAAYGTDGLYLTYAIMFVVALLPAAFMSPHGIAAVGDVETGEDHHHIAIPASLPWLCIFAVFGFYLTIGSYWAYVEIIGESLGYEAEFLGSLMAKATFLSLIGCYGAYWFSQRMGQSKPFLIALLIIAVTCLASGTGITNILYFTGLGVIFLFWNFVDIYQLGTLAHIDNSGRFAALVPGAQGLAMAIGPAAGGYLLGQGFGYEVIMIFAGFGSLIALVAYAIVYARLRRLAPDLADAE